jgi:hypothetical protein
VGGLVTSRVAGGVDVESGSRADLPIGNGRGGSAPAVPPADRGGEPFGPKPASTYFPVLRTYDNMLAHGETVRVREGKRVLFRLLSASPTENITLALAGHRFTIVALDGNPAPTQRSVDTVFLAPAERADVIVEMNRPGVWVLGGVKDDDRKLASVSWSNTPTSAASRNGRRRRSPHGTTPSLGPPSRCCQTTNASTCCSKKCPAATGL